MRYEQLVMDLIIARHPWYLSLPPHLGCQKGVVCGPPPPLSIQAAMLGIGARVALVSLPNRRCGVMAALLQKWL